MPVYNKYSKQGKKDKSSNKKSEKISKKNKATHSVFLLYLPLSTIITRGSLPLQMFYISMIRERLYSLTLEIDLWFKRGGALRQVIT